VGGRRLRVCTYARMCMCCMNEGRCMCSVCKRVAVHDFSHTRWQYGCVHVCMCTALGLPSDPTSVSYMADSVGYLGLGKRVEGIHARCGAGGVCVRGRMRAASDALVSGLQDFPMQDAPAIGCVKHILACSTITATHSSLACHANTACCSFRPQ
jgi:hypothetical protein